MCFIYMHTTCITIFIVDISTFVEIIQYQIYIPTFYSIAEFLK